MKKNEVKVGAVYRAKVTDKVVSVRIDGKNQHGGWDATNLKTKRKVHIKSAQRLRSEVKGKRALAASAAADEENARLRDERKASADGMTASERAMAKSAKKTKVTKAETKEAVAAVVANDAKAAEITKKSQPKKEAKPRRVSALDAAAEVLRKAGQPMRSKELIAAMAEQGLWSSPKGKTPEATLYAAMLREIGNKGDAARFKKVERGQFAFNG